MITNIKCNSATSNISTFTFMSNSQKAYKTEQLLQNKFFNSMFNLESDKMTAM